MKDVKDETVVEMKETPTQRPAASVPSPRLSVVVGSPLVSATKGALAAEEPTDVEAEKMLARSTSSEEDTEYKKQLCLALLGFCFGAIGMTTGNKLAVEYLKDAEGRSLPTTLVGIQMLGTLLLLACNAHHINVAQISFRHAAKWFLIFVCSAFGMFSSAESYVYVSVSFVIIMRNIGTITTTLAEYLVRGKTVTLAVLAAEVTIVFGIILYGYSMLAFKHFWMGFFWCSVNTLAVTVWSVLLKHMTESDSDIKAMNKYVMSFYNNLMGLPTFAALAWARGEVALYPTILPQVPPAGWVTITATCIIGYIISTSGFALARLVSATSMHVVSNLCKVFNILLGLAFLGDRFPGWISVVGCVIALGAAAWYSYLQTSDKDKESIRFTRMHMNIVCCAALLVAAGVYVYTTPIASLA